MPITRFIPASIALAFLLLPGALTAQQRWIEDSPPGGEIFDLAMDPFDPDRLLAASGQLFVTRTGGTQWQARSASLLGGFTSLAFSPSQRGLLYAVQDKFLMRSLDGGASFVRLATTQNVRSGQLLVVDPSDGDRLYLRLPLRQELLRSDDGGITWKLIEPPEPFHLQGFALQPGSPQVLLAVSGSTVFRSQDRGETWRAVLEREELSFQRLLFVDPQTVIAGGNRIWISRDGGFNWVRQEQAPEGIVQALAASSSPSRLYATTGKGVFTSQDGAVSWQSASQGLGVFPKVTELIVDPRDSAVVHAASAAAGVFTTRNAGLEWQVNSRGIGAESNQVLELPESGDLVAATEGGLFIRRRTQTRWQLSGGECSRQPGQTCLQDPSPVLALARGRAGLYAASRHGLFVSRDEGHGWQEIEDQELLAGCSSLAAGESDGETVVYCINRFPERNLVKIRDDGAQIQVERINRHFIGSREVALDRQRPERVFLVTAWSAMFGVRGGGLHLSEDGGSSWRSVDPANRQGLTNVAFNSARPQRVLVSQRQTVWTSDDGGFTFRSSTLETDRNNSIQDLVIDPRNPDTFYAATVLEVFSSRDAGRSWTLLSSDPPPGLFRRLSFSQSAPHLLLAATRRGVFKLPLEAGVRRLPLAFAGQAAGSLLLHNPLAESQAAGLIRLFDEQGQVSSGQTVEVPPLGVGRIEIPAGPSSGWAEVAPFAEAPALQAVQLLEDSQGVAALGSAPLTGRFTLPVLNGLDGSGAPFDTLLAVANSGDRPQRVHLELRDSGSETHAAFDLDLPPLGHQLVRVASIDWEFLSEATTKLKDFVGAVEGEASGTVIAGGLLRKGSRFGFLTAAVPSSARSFRRTLTEQHELLFPQFGDGQRGGAGVQARLILYNPGPVPIRAQIDFYDDEGAPLPTALNGFSPSGATSAAIPARSVKLLESDLSQGLDFGWLRVSSALRLDGWLLMSGNIGTAVLDGNPSASSRIALPVLNSTAPFSVTGFTVANPGAEMAAARLSLHGSDGRRMATSQLALPPLGHRSRFLSELDWTPEPGAVLDLAEFQGLLIIESPAPLSASLLQLGPGRFALLPIGE